MKNQNICNQSYKIKTLKLKNLFKINKVMFKIIKIAMIMSFQINNNLKIFINKKKKF